MTDAPDDANDLPAPRLSKVDGQPLTDRVLIGKEPFCKTLTDDDYPRTVGTVLLTQDAAPQHRNTHRAEIIRTGHTLVRVVTTGLRLHDRPAFNPEARVVFPPAQRQFGN